MVKSVWVPYSKSYAKRRGKTGRFVEIKHFASKYKGGGLQIISEIESFVSPVDNRVVGNRRQLREHNRANEVVDKRDFKGHQFKTAELPSVTSELVRAYKENTGKL